MGGHALSKTAILDGDIIAYQAASVAMQQIDWDGDGNSSLYHNKGTAQQAVMGTTDRWIKTAGTKQAVVALSDRSRPQGTFRYRISHTYKTGRSEAARPELLDYARGLLMANYDTIEWSGLEADDVIGILMTGDKGDQHIAVSLDKDMFTLPGTHVHPVTGITTQQDKLSADLYWATQTITGDVVDGYPGIPGAGAVAAKKWLDGRNNRSDMFEAILQLASKQHSRPKQKAKFLGTDYASFAIEQARLAHILQDGDYKGGDDPQVRLWQPNNNGRWINAYANVSVPPGPNH